MSSIFEFYISKLGYMKFSWKSDRKMSLNVTKFDYLPDEDGKKVDAENENNDENKNLEEWIWVLNFPYQN